jgi:SH3-like domain-containing protein
MAAAGFAMALLALAAALPSLAQGERVGQVTGLPLPRFVSLKGSEVNVRGGPGTNYEIVWTYVRSGYPVEVIQEFDLWRRIRDASGEEGWVLGNLLSSERTAVVAPADGSPTVPLRAEPSASGRVVAYLAIGVQASVERCAGGWCRLVDPRFSGWVLQHVLWGVYPNEEFN